jgi:exodeoxyribonuclease V alpha subunit
VLARLPAHCRVVLLGDPDQLASVEPGRVLGDLAGVPDDHPLATATVRLRVNWRSGAAPALATLVRGLQEGDPRALAWVETPMPQESNTWVHRCDLPTRPGSLLQALATTHHPWIDRILTDARQDPGQALLALEQVRLLTVLRQGDWGSDALNQRWEELLCRNGRIHPDAQGHYLGRPLLVTANRPDLDLSNGDIGVVSPMDGGWALRVPAIDGTRAVPLHRLEGLQPAWFLTVHKAQGSQGEHVEVIGLPTDATTAQRQLATREMAYTAITRASRRLRIWWDAPGLAASLTTRETARRSSQLAMLLKRGAAAQPAA